MNSYTQRIRERKLSQNIGYSVFVVCMIWVNISFIMFINGILYVRTALQLPIIDEQQTKARFALSVDDFSVNP